MANKYKPKLSNEELIKLAKNGDEEAKEELFRWNMRLCYHIAQKFKNVDDVEELAAIGNLGLIKAYNTFDLSKGIKFATYATMVIQNEVLMYNRRIKKHDKVSSYDAVAYSNKDGSEVSFLDMIATPEKDFTLEDNEHVNSILEEFKKDCSEREIKIIDMIYFQKKTQREVCEALGISQSYISRIEKKIILKLRKISNKLLGDVNMRSKNEKIKGQFKYLWENYEGIISKYQMASILGFKSDGNIYHYIKEYSKGKLNNIAPDSSIEKSIPDKYKVLKQAKGVDNKINEFIGEAKNSWDDSETKSDFYYHAKPKKTFPLDIPKIEEKTYTTLEVLSLVSKYTDAISVSGLERITKNKDGSFNLNEFTMALTSLNMSFKWKLAKKPVETQEALSMIANGEIEELLLVLPENTIKVGKHTPITIEEMHIGKFYYDKE